MIRLITDIPGPRSRTLFERRREAVPRGPFNVAPIFIRRARGALLEDVDGNTFIDFAGGLGCLNVGSSHGEVTAALADQIQDYLHTCFHVAMNEPYIELAERLNQFTPGAFPKKTFLANSGAEAAENAVKIARSFTGRPAVVAFEDGFHGRTLLALSLTSKVKPYKFGFGPFAPEIYRLPYPYCYRCPRAREGPDCCMADAGAILRDFFKRHVAAEAVAAVIIEPVLGEGGFVVPPRQFVVDLQRVCRSHGILLIADEIQTGIARTGTLFACEQFGIEPDLILAAKSLGAGLPIASVTGRAEIMDHPMVGGLGGTFGGNPLACRAALAVLDVIERDGLCSRAKRIGEMILQRFREFHRKYPIIGDVRGMGAMCAMEFVRDRASKEPAKEETEQFARRALERGVVTIPTGTFGNVIRMLVPLVISDEELEAGLRVFDQLLGEFEEERRGGPGVAISLNQRVT